MSNDFKVSHYKTHFKLGAPAPQEQMRECHTIVKRVVYVIIARMSKQAELHCYQYDFDDLNAEFVGKSNKEKSLLDADD